MGAFRIFIIMLVLNAGATGTAWARFYVCTLPNGEVKYHLSAENCPAVAPAVDLSNLKSIVPERKIIYPDNYKPETPAQNSTLPAPALKSSIVFEPAARATPAPQITKPSQPSGDEVLASRLILDNVLAQTHPVNLNDTYDLTRINKSRHAGRIKIILHELEKEKKIVQSIKTAQATHSAAGENFLNVFTEQLNQHYLNIRTLSQELKNLGFF